MKELLPVPPSGVTCHRHPAACAACFRAGAQGKQDAVLVNAVAPTAGLCQSHCGSARILQLRLGASMATACAQGTGTPKQPGCRYPGAGGAPGEASGQGSTRCSRVCTGGQPSSSWADLPQPPRPCASSLRRAGRALRRCGSSRSAGPGGRCPAAARGRRGCQQVPEPRPVQSHWQRPRTRPAPPCPPQRGGVSLPPAPGSYLRQEKVPKSAPAAMPTAKPIMKPIFTLSKQLGCDCPYGPTVTGICKRKPRPAGHRAARGRSGAGGAGRSARGRAGGSARVRARSLARQGGRGGRGPGASGTSRPQRGPRVPPRPRISPPRARRTVTPGGDPAAGPVLPSCQRPRGRKNRRFGSPSRAARRLPPAPRPRTRRAGGLSARFPPGALLPRPPLRRDPRGRAVPYLAAPRPPPPPAPGLRFRRARRRWRKGRAGAGPRAARGAAMLLWRRLAAWRAAPRPRRLSAAAAPPPAPAQGQRPAPGKAAVGGTELGARAGPAGGARSRRCRWRLTAARPARSPPSPQGEAAMEAAARGRSTWTSRPPPRW